MFWEVLNDPLLLLFLLLVIIVATGTVICLVALFARAGHDSSERYERLQMHREYSRHIRRLDSDYKALVESYLRETGKVWIPPSTPDVPTHFPPAQPSAFRFRPPVWATPSTAPTPAPMQSDYLKDGDE